MSRYRRRAASRTLVAVATAALILVAGLSVAGPSSVSSAQTPDAPFTVTPSQTANLSDGQPVDLDVAMRSDLTAVSVNAYVCRPGVAYTENASLSTNSGNCPVSVPISASADVSNWVLRTYESGHKARGTIIAATGTAEWTSTITSERFSLTCDPTHPCLLVVRAQVRTTSGSVVSYFDTSTTLSYQDSDPTASCGGAAPGALRSAGAERMLPAWREWTLADCNAHPANGGAVTLSPVPDEGVAVTDFAADQRDIVYAAAGQGEPGFTASTPRATVATPVAVNAVVLAAAGGSFPDNDPSWPAGLRKPYSDIKLTAPEIAILLGQGQSFLDIQRGTDVLARNPELGRVFPASDSKPPMALAGASALSLYMTRYLDYFADADWKAGPADGFAPRGMTANLGVPESPSEPTFANSLSVVSDPSQVDKTVYGRILNIIPSNLGPQWVWTDLATATRLGMTPVAIPNANGEWVTPTPASLAAAVPTMTRQSNGMLAPNITTTAAGAYPLTIVEYALAPAEPLVDTACAPRTESQKLLGDWLNYVTGDGQAKLPHGFVGLTPALQAEAAAAIAKVGKTTSTCNSGPGPTTTTTIPGTTTTTSPLGSSPTDGSTGGDGGSGYRSPEHAGNSPYGGTTPRASTPKDRRESANAVDDAEVKTPPFRGIRGFNEVVSPLSLLLILLTTSGAAFLTSGRALPAFLLAVWRFAVMVVVWVRRRLRLPRLALRRAS